MLISSLEEMETIVKKNKSLMWDGWTVVHFYPSDKAKTSRFGGRIKDKWCMIRRFDASEAGWEIPNKFLRR
jgi:hypothetical protein